jgi:hypothetical protein
MRPLKIAARIAETATRGRIDIAAACPDAVTVAIVDGSVRHLDLYSASLRSPIGTAAEPAGTKFDIFIVETA